MSGTFIPATERDVTRIVQSVRDLFMGRSNASGSFTLTASATTTTVSHKNCGPDSRIVFSPTTANAAAALATTYHSGSASGTFTITHASNIQTDRTFSYRIVD